MTEAQTELNESTYVALGRFVVAFSGVLRALETSTVHLLGPLGGGGMLIEAALADRTASPIMSSFFSVFYAHWGDGITEGDKKILQFLRRELTELIQIRNRLMHDAWMSTKVGGNDDPQPLSRLRVRAHGTGVEYELAKIEPASLEELASKAHNLSRCINGIVWYMRPGQAGPEIEQRFQISEGKLQRV